MGDEFVRSEDVESPLKQAVEVVGVPISGMSLDEAVERAVSAIHGGQTLRYSTANAHSIVTAQHDEPFMAQFSAVDAVLPDGILPVWAGRALGGHIPSRVPGPDFTEAFLARAAESNVSVFFLGATQETLDQIRSYCERRFPGLEVAGTYSPPFGEFSGAENSAMIDAVNASGAQALFVGMTAPKQEVWIAAHSDRIQAPFAIGVGAAFDFMAGNRARAPRWVGNAGLEWLYRLVQEPRRLWRRNVNSAVFLGLFARQVIRRRMGKD